MKNLIEIDFADLDFDDMEKYVFEQTSKKIYVAANLLEEQKLEILLQLMNKPLDELQKLI